MFQKALVILKFGLIGLLIAMVATRTAIGIALLNLAIANWVVGFTILIAALLLLRNEQKLKRLKEERAMLQEEFLQQDVLRRMRLLDELMRSHARQCSSSYICRSCKYFHGRSGVVCAVHPEGCVGNQCGDFEAKY